MPRGDSQLTRCLFLEPAFDPRNAELQNNITQSNTIARIFGTNTSAFELLVLKRKIKGPCWLNIKEPKVSENKVCFVHSCDCPMLTLRRFTDFMDRP